MKVRQRKKQIMFAMFYIAANARWDRWINGIMYLTPEEIEESKRRHEEAWEILRQSIAPVQAPVIEKIWKVARVKDGVVMLETTDLSEAEEMIEKAVRQKKAKLVLVADDLVPYEAKNFTHMV